jgi:hypothetical protein
MPPSLNSNPASRSSFRSGPTRHCGFHRLPVHRRSISAALRSAKQSEVPLEDQELRERILAQRPATCLGRAARGCR